MARRSADSPAAPWLVHRDQLDWGWRSFARVADQVARGVDALRDPTAPVAAGPTPTVAPNHPDAVAAALAVLTDGTPLTFGAEGWWPPACRSALDREPLLDLASRIEPGPAAVDTPILVAGRARRVGDLVSDARALIARLPAERAHPQHGARRPILTTGAGLPPDCLLTVGIASLLLDAVWALEPQTDAFASAVTWTRPTLVVATDDELAALAERWDRSCRRWSRLRAIVRWRSTDDERSGELPEQLGAPWVEWSASRQGAA